MSWFGLGTTSCDVFPKKNFFMEEAEMWLRPWVQFRSALKNARRCSSHGKPSSQLLDKRGGDYASRWLASHQDGRLPNLEA